MQDMQSVLLVTMQDMQSVLANWLGLLLLITYIYVWVCYCYKPRTDYLCNLYYH